MNNKEYLNEEQYQKTSKKIGRIGLALFIFGAISFFIVPFVVSMLDLPHIFFIFPMLGVPCFGIGLFLFISSKQRSISAFYAQSQMPVAQEGIEKMAPSIGKAGATVAKEMAPVYGDIAKEIAKGIKEGIKDEEESKIN